MKFKGTGVIASTDYKTVKWVGKTKDGSAVTIELKDAINLGNIDWTFADKGEVVPEITMTATYDNTNEALTDKTEPWTVECNGTPTGAGEILLDVGKFYVGETAIALTRGGGKFNVERSFREITADGDMGPVKDRIILEESRASLALNALTILNRFADLYSAIGTVE